MGEERKGEEEDKSSVLIQFQVNKHTANLKDNTTHYTLRAELTCNQCEKWSSLPGHTAHICTHTHTHIHTSVESEAHFRVTCTGMGSEGMCHFFLCIATTPSRMALLALSSMIPS